MAEIRDVPNNLPAALTSDEVCADDHVIPRLHVPKRERAVEDIDAVAVRPLALPPRVRSHDVQAVHVNVAALHAVACEDLHSAGGCSTHASPRADPSRISTVA